MKFFNIREGFATNSSSSHSILVLPEEKTVRDDISESFGWDFFTASAPQSKQEYLASIIFNNLTQVGYSKKKAKKFIFDFFGVKEDKDFNYQRGVDHQSVWTLPRTWDGKDINQEFLNELKDYVLKKNVVIVGGNDNTDAVHPLSSDKQTKQSVLHRFERETDSSFLVARKDASHWVLFNKMSGNKVRISFDDIENPNRALAPELVDIKITDFCPFDCSFCYQDSTLEGKHASLDFITKVADELKAAKVFEVALGGGETTLHPQFLDILKIFASRGIIPNFTTKNMNFFKSEYAKEIIDICGGIAFSASSVEDIKKVKLALVDFNKREKVQVEHYDTRYTSDEIDKNKPWAARINYQIVLGVMSEKELSAMLNEISPMLSRVTLLGYKDVGRGQDFAPHKYDKWLDIVEKVQKKSGLMVSIDTALAAEFSEQLSAKKVDSRTYHINEGNFSAYIDAVQKFIAPASYGGLEQKKDFDENWLNSWNEMTYTPSFKKSFKIGAV